MQKIKNLLILVLLICSFSACVKKQVVFKTKYLCEKQEIYEKPKAQIRVLKEDEGVAKAFIKANDTTIKNYEKQVLEHNEACKKIKDLKNGK